MPRNDDLSAADAARRLGISLDTLRRWDRDGKIAVSRDGANRRRVAASEVERLLDTKPQQLSARNRFAGVVSSVEVDGLLAQVEIEVTGPLRIIAVITRDAVESLGLVEGSPATGIVKSTSVLVER